MYDKTEYIETFDTSTDQVTEKSPVTTNVQYARYIENIPVVGAGGFIYIDLGNNGELIYLNKVWRTVTPAGNVSIQPVTTAIEKLRHGEVLNPKYFPYNVSITKIRLGYYEKGRGESQEYLDPAWLFRGTTEQGDPIQYYVYARQFANFTATPADVTMFQPVQFTDTSETTPTKWYWEFGDGTNSTDQNPSHLYKTGGNYTVNLTTWNDMGSDTISRQDYVHVYYSSPAPVAGYSSNYTMGNPVANVSPVAIRFTDQSLVSGNNTRWYWDFGDGTNSSEQNPVHAFAYQERDNCSYYDCLETLYLVTLTVTDNYGRNSTVSDYFNIIRDTHIDFAGDPPSGASPLTVNFSEMPDEIPEIMVSTRLWDYGDGSVYVWSVWDGEPPVTNISHTYTSPGNYTVTFSKEILDWGIVFEKTKGYYVAAAEHPNPPVAEFTANVTSGISPLGVAFSDHSLNSPTNWTWSFGDGTTSTDQYPVHVYTTAGTYTVSLTTSNAGGGNITSKVDYISVFDNIPPAANFTANKTFGSEPLAVAFSDLSLNGPVQWNWSFGDGNISLEKDPVHTYATEGKYPVSLQVTNEYGSDTMVRPDYITVIGAYPIVTITVPHAISPLANFTAAPLSGKLPLTVQFNDTSSNFPDTLFWDFGDGTNTTGKDPVHIYSSAGNYTVSLNATNAAGTNMSVRVDYISVLPLTLPDANFTAAPTAGKTPLTVVFNDTSSGSPTGWLWDFGDGTTSAEQHPIHGYTTTGNYTVSLTATNDDGSDTESRPDFITVTSLILPVADFTANTTSGNVPLAVRFTDISSGSPTGWRWTFGDSGTSAERNPVHIYTTTGQFTVTLQVTNEDGSNTTTKEQFIAGSALNLPVAEFIANTTSGNAPLAVEFTDQSTRSPVSWSWSFGDGAASAEQNPSHTYTNTGTYTVSLEVTNPDGSNTATKTDYITVTSNTRPPVTSFTGKPTCGKAPLSVKFTDTSTGSPTTWYWDFGDGTNATDRNPVHIYTSPGKYTVSLTATNAGGSNTSTRIDYITVSESVKPPVANFNGKPTSGKAPLSVKFTDTSTGSPTTWYWEFGDGTNDTAQHPVHSYTSPGKYTVSLTVTRGGGSNTKTRTEYITVKGTPPPTVNFNGKPTSGKAPLSVKFTDTSTGSPTGWYWEFGDGTNGTVQHPVHSYTIAGKYTVSLTASNAGGNITKTRTQYITVTGSTTPTPTHTCTPSQCGPHEVPQVTGIITQDNKVRLDWDVITNPCLQGYKVVISKNNPNPKYPDDGYMFWITNRNTNYSVISSTDHYNGGDFGGYLQPGQSYYFSITAIYSDKKVPGNTIGLTFPTN